MKTLSLTDAFQQATKGPLLFESYGPQYCFHEGNRAAIVKVEHDDGEQVESTVAEVWSTSGDTDKYDAALLTHCFNHFQEVVEALEASLKVAVAHALDCDPHIDLKPGESPDFDAAVMEVDRLRSVLAKASTVQMPP